LANTVDQSIAPFFNDFDEDKSFYQVLFKPETAVQARELTGLQSILQNQITRFGNNIFKRGTIVDGVNFIFYDNYPYIKINDIQIDGLNSIPENYLNFMIKNENGLNALIINYEDGFETAAPDLKSLYLKYTNSGSSFNETSFAAGQVLTVYDSNNSIHSININARGNGYTNSDIIVVTPTLLANVNSGTFEIGDIITDSITNARGIITSVEDESIRLPRVNLFGTVDVTSGSANVTGTGTSFTNDFANGDYLAIYSNTSSYSLKKINVVSNSSFMNLTTTTSFTNATSTYANTTPSRLYVSYKPVVADLANNLTTSNNWSFGINGTLVGSTNTDILQVISIIGDNAGASLLTDSVGRIDSISVSNRGSGYSRLPEVSIKSLTGSSANLSAQNYYAQVTVASTSNSVGSGYAFGITSGVIYQKGYFIKVFPQTIIVEKYSRSPNNVTVGFVTNEDIINANIDTSLFDNSAGFTNFNAPGADRLKLSANLEIKTISESDEDIEFFNLVEWSEGFPYKQNNRTFYNVINDQMADRHGDITGNYVVDRFLVTTQSPSNNSLEANTVNIVVDPGTAYIDGYKVQTLHNYTISSDKAIDTKISNDSRVSLNYENYIRIKEVGGFFEFDRGNTVNLYDTAKSFITTNAVNTTPSGNIIGTARIRNFVLEQGNIGTAGAIYRLYLFDIKMNSGKNFKNIRSIHYDGASFDGVGDAVLENNPSTSQNEAILYGKNNSLVFFGGYDSPLVSNNVNYIYRTISETDGVANTGIINISLTGSPNKVFPYSGNLSDVQKNEIYLAPSANLIAQANLTGTVNVTSTSSNVLGNGTTFLSTFKVGDQIYITDGLSNNAFGLITSVVNNTFLTTQANIGFTQTTVNIKRGWKANVPMALSYRSNISANVNGTGDVLSINIGSTLNTATNTGIIIAYNVENQNPTPTAKTPKRNLFVKLRLANNAANTVGPWSLGVPDIFRLRNVYVGNSSVDETYSDITEEFFIDHNQNSNYYDLGLLYKNTNSTVSLDSNQYLLVKFDAFESNPGYYNISSYVSSNKLTRFTEDSKPLSNLISTVNTFEIPELYGDDGKYYDLIQSIDFRPVVDATANLTSNISNVTLNPTTVVSFSSADRYFPLPDSIFTHDVEYFDGRIDNIILDKNSTIKIIKGISGSGIINSPSGSMILNSINIPSYPSLPTNISSATREILSTSVYSNKQLLRRINDKIIKTTFNSTDYSLQQPLNYTQRDIGSIDRRVKDLEYYVSFTLLQSEIIDRLIPSSVSPNINRFKYGFFVDDYNNVDFSEATSPEYCASTSNGFATPLLTSFNVVHSGDGFSASEYSEELLLTQTSATLDPVITNPPPPSTLYIGNMIITNIEETKHQREPTSDWNFVSNVNMTWVTKWSTWTTDVYWGINKIATVAADRTSVSIGGWTYTKGPKVSDFYDGATYKIARQRFYSDKNGHFKTQKFIETGTTGNSPSTTNNSNSKIVCTAMNEAYGFGSFRNAIWMEHSANMSKEYEIGYHALFLPLVNRIYRSDKKDTKVSKFIKSVAERITRKRTADLWKMKKGGIDLEGRVYRLILEPLCFVAGKVLINKNKKDDQ
jgi:Domain of unknown function (DUF4815)